VRSRRIGAAVASGCLLAVVLATVEARASDPAPVRQAGERAAAKGCGACHALSGEARGKRPGPAFLSPAPPQAPSEVLRRLWNHIPAMRQYFLARGITWPEFRVEEMGELLAFLGMQPSLERAPNLDRGRALVMQKGCLKCHALAGEGGRIAPDLTQFRQFRDPLPLATALWNHAPAMLDRIDQSGIPYPIFQAGEVADLVGYLGATANVSR
jgi:cytochrome c551/c552